MQKDGAAGAGRSAQGGKSGHGTERSETRACHLKLVYSSDWEHEPETPQQIAEDKRPDMTMIITLVAAIIGLTMPMVLWMWLGHAP